MLADPPEAVDFSPRTALADVELALPRDQLGWAETGAYTQCRRTHDVGTAVSIPSIHSVGTEPAYPGPRMHPLHTNRVDQGGGDTDIVEPVPIKATGPAGITKNESINRAVQTGVRPDGRSPARDGSTTAG